MLLFHHHQCTSTMLVFQRWVSNYLIRIAGKVGKQIGPFCTALCTQHTCIATWTNSVIAAAVPLLPTQHTNERLIIHIPRKNVDSSIYITMSDLTFLSHSSYCCPFDDNIQCSAVGWGIQLKWLYLLRQRCCDVPATQTHSPKPASAQKRGLPLPCHACQNVRRGATEGQLEWARAICVKERGVGVELQGLSLV